MNTINWTQIVQYLTYLGVLLIAGGAEYLKIVPQGTFFPILTLVVGHFFGQQPIVNVVKQSLNGKDQSKG